MAAVRLLSRLLTREGILPEGTLLHAEPAEAAHLTRLGCAEPTASSPAQSPMSRAGDDAGGGAALTPPPAPAKRPRPRS